MSRDDGQANVWRLYERFARAFDRDRGRALVERGYLDEMLGHLGERPALLDLGCGSGEPIARYLIERGGWLTGVDAASSMIALCRERFPDGEWIVGDMRALHLDRRFDGIVAWDSFFHLPADDQRPMFEVFRQHIAAAGLLLFTSGPRAGTAKGDFYGHELFHASLDPQDYETLLRDTGFKVLRHRAEDPGCGGHTVWLAQSLP